jgi:pimeloyl-ACP methyl ester carboxylesterase
MRGAAFPLEQLQRLVAYWRTGYNWRRFEARINTFPQFRTEIDGLGFHFIHVRSRHANALPILLTHGWPGSVIEFLKVIGPLANPTAHGGRAEDAFHVVLPSLPGYGFSDKPAGPGWNSTSSTGTNWTEAVTSPRSSSPHSSRRNSGTASAASGVHNFTAAANS